MINRKTCRIRTQNGFIDIVSVVAYVISINTVIKRQFILQRRSMYRIFTFLFEIFRFSETPLLQRKLNRCALFLKTASNNDRRTYIPNQQSKP